VPTKYPRIAVTNDPELADALARVARLYDGLPASKVIRELAIKGAEAVERQDEERRAAMERLIEFSTKRTDLIDWDVLARIDELAWGYPPRDAD
jgi:hypothetical protein